jgi:hypothetical protein
MRLMLLMLMMPVAGCVSASPDAICAGTQSDTATLAAALAETPDDRVAVAGAALVVRLDAACWRG